MNLRPHWLKPLCWPQLWLAAALLLSSTARADDKLAVLSGHDADTATDFIVFSLAAEPRSLPGSPASSSPAPSSPAPSSPAPGSTAPGSTAPDQIAATPPYVTFQCRQTAGRRYIDLFVDFGSAGNRAYHPPEKPDPITKFPPPHPNATLRITFVGYMTSKAIKRTWAALPNGELQYRPPGSYSPNLEEVRYYLAWLTSLPILRLTDVHDETRSADFNTAALLDHLRHHPLCQP